MSTPLLQINCNKKLRKGCFLRFWELHLLLILIWWGVCCIKGFSVLPRFLCYCRACQTFYYLFPLLSILQQHPWAGPFLEMGLCGITLTSNLHLIIGSHYSVFFVFPLSPCSLCSNNLGWGVCSNESLWEWQCTFVTGTHRHCEAGAC